MTITPNSIENVNIILKFTTNVLAFEFGMNFGWLKLHFFLFLVYVIIEN